MASEADRTDEATDLLQHLIRNRCVNDGTDGSGHEHRSADLLRHYLEGSGADLETYEPQPGRTSLVAKLEGTDPSAPSLTLLGHTDVVPANPDDWSQDPFGGELIDGEVWGRGAIDMLNLTATMAPTVMRAGTKLNVIPDRVELDVDIRTLPGWDTGDVEAMLEDVIGDLADDVTIEIDSEQVSTTSPIDTPLWGALERVSRIFYPGTRTVPYLTVGATDARFHRALGAVAYGFGLHSTAISFEQYGAMFHGIDERVDVESLRLSTEMWIALAHDFLV